MHVVYLSATAMLPALREVCCADVSVTVETMHHYLCFAAEDVRVGKMQFKCCSPIREVSNQDALWDALREGVVDYVVSDHSPCVGELKRLGVGEGMGDFMKAWGGIGGVQFGLCALWTEGASSESTHLWVLAFVCELTFRGYTSILNVVFRI
jgi:allantoinase